MALGDFDQNREERMESPDSGINFDFDIEGCSALLSGNDPILNNAQVSSPLASGDQDKSMYHDDSSSVINTTELYLPVVNTLNTNTSDDNDTIRYMDTSDEEENDDQENVSNNTVKIDTNKIHSYSVLNLKKRTLKTRRPIKPSTKKLTLKSQGQKISVSVRNKKKQKLYEMESLNDPVAERNRLNAINAKKNRDRKKQQLAEAEDEIEKLREENEELKAETDNYKDQLEEAMRELKSLKQLFKTQVGSLPPHLDDAEE